MFKVLERLGDPAPIEDTQHLEPVFYDPAKYDPASFEEFEAEFYVPEEQEPPVISVSMRTAALVGTGALMVAGIIGYEAHGPADEQPEISTQQIEHDLNKKDEKKRTTAEPMPILHDYKLDIPTQESEDKPMAAHDLINLGAKDGKYTYGIFDFDETGKATVIKLRSEVPAEPTKDSSHEIVVPVSVVYTEVTTKSGKTEKVYSAVAGDKSGNAADTVKIDTEHASPEQKRLLQDPKLKGLVKDAVGLTAQPRVGYLDIGK